MNYTHDTKSEDSGVYQITIQIKKKTSIKIGELGEFTFEPGTYIYTGRAKKGLQKRIQRHLRKEKRCFWHIDYLLQSNNAEITNIAITSDNYRTECAQNKDTQNHNAQIPISGFGSSDCKNHCKAHLVLVN